MPDNSIVDAKQRLRDSLIAARRRRSETDRQAARRSVGEHLLTAVAGVRCVAAYLPLPTEPLDRHLLDEIASFARVLVPVVTGADALEWCEYPVRVRRGRLGIEEPLGERLGRHAVADADVVLVPALAVDRGGHRLGRGGGHYDRTLALRASLRISDADDRLIAPIYDEEFVDEVPHDELDQRVSAIVSPSGGARSVG